MKGICELQHTRSQNSDLIETRVNEIINLARGTAKGCQDTDSIDDSAWVKAVGTMRVYKQSTTRSHGCVLGSSGRNDTSKGELLHDESGEVFLHSRTQRAMREIFAKLTRREQEDFDQDTSKVLRYRIMTPRDNNDRNHNCGSAHLGLQQKWYKVRKCEGPLYGGAFSYVLPAFQLHLDLSH